MKESARMCECKRERERERDRSPYRLFEEKLLMVNDGDLRCTTVTVLTGFSVGFSGFLGSPFSLSTSYNVSGCSSASYPSRWPSLSISCPFLAVFDGLSERLDNSCDDWLCDRLLSPPSGVCLGSCSVDRRNLFRLSLRTNEFDFFFFFFKVVDGPTTTLRSPSSSTELRFRPVSVARDRQRIFGQRIDFLPGGIFPFFSFSFSFLSLWRLW